MYHSSCLKRRDASEIREARIMAGNEDNMIDQITENRQPHFEPYGWHHWPEHPWLSYQFRRGLGETQEGGGAISEIFQAASRMIPGDKESWHREWMRVADRILSRGRGGTCRPHPDRHELLPARRRLFSSGGVLCSRTSRDGWRRSPRWNAAATASWALDPPGEILEIPYEATLYAYFVRAPFPGDRQPCLISMGGSIRSRTRCGSCRRTARCSGVSPC